MCVLGAKVFNERRLDIAVFVIRLKVKLDEGQPVPAKMKPSCQGCQNIFMGKGSMTHIGKVNVFLFFQYH